jgi:hypothetical protein
MSLNPKYDTTPFRDSLGRALSIFLSLLINSNKQTTFSTHKIHFGGIDVVVPDTFSVSEKKDADNLEWLLSSLRGLMNTTTSELAEMIVLLEQLLSQSKIPGQTDPMISDLTYISTFLCISLNLIQKTLSTDDPISLRSYVNLLHSPVWELARWEEHIVIRLNWCMKDSDADLIRGLKMLEIVENTFSKI